MVVAAIRGRNCSRYIGRCLKSLIGQSYTDWKALVVLDAPTDNSEAVARQIANRSENIKIVVQPKRFGLGYNMKYAIDKAIIEFGASPDDIIAVVDADDWLLPKAFRKVVKTYEKHEGCLLTYGSYVKQSKGRRTKVSRKYADGCSVRREPWHASHLKTFKAKLYEKLNDDSVFKDSKGKWLDAASDLALMFPLIELAGLHRCRHIAKAIYMWRDSTPQKTKRALQLECEKIVRAKLPLKMAKI